MATAEGGHHPNTCYIDRDGNFHLNGSSIYADESGTAISGTDLASTDGVIATPAEINRVADVSTRCVAIAADTTITLDAYSDKIILLNKAGTEVTVTLPAATGTGARFKFYQQLVNTSKYHVLAAAGDVMCGNILTNSSADSQSCQPWISLAATANIRITLNGTTQGGVSIGDWVELVDVATDRWAVTGLTTSSGTEATPFATS
mgnify:CR=1 FL=1